MGSQTDSLGVILSFHRVPRQMWAVLTISSELLTDLRQLQNDMEENLAVPVNLGQSYA
jgi:hypothetical protein